jgi:hypothetical protein
MLDEIERMIHGLSEHPFMIPGKLTAVCASRLSRTDSLNQVTTVTDYRTEIGQLTSHSQKTDVPEKAA